MNIKNILLSGAALSILWGFSSYSVAGEAGLKFLGEYTIPTSFTWKNVPLGGYPQSAGMRENSASMPFLTAATRQRKASRVFIN